MTLNGERNVEGVLRGYDQFMNVVLENCVECNDDGDRIQLGMSVIRGKSIVALEVLPQGS